MRWAGRLLVVRRGGVLPSATVAGQSDACWWCASSGLGRRCTFILPPGARADRRVRVVLPFTDRGL